MRTIAGAAAAISRAAFTSLSSANRTAPRFTHRVLRNSPAARPNARVFTSMSAAEGPAFANTTCQEALQLLDSGAYSYLDVRGAAQFAEGHPGNAINVPFRLGTEVDPDFQLKVQELFPEKDAQVLVGCQLGKTSLMAADLLAKAGYTSLINVEGGYQAWLGAGLPVTK